MIYKLDNGGIVKLQKAGKIAKAIIKVTKRAPVSSLDNIPIWKRVFPIMRTVQDDLTEMNKYHQLNVNEYNKTFGTNIQSTPFRTEFPINPVKITPRDEFVTSININNHNSPTKNAENVGGYYSRTDDQVNLPNTAKSSGIYHEFEHMGQYGLTNPEVTRWRIEQLVDPEKTATMTDNAKAYFLSEEEFPVHLRQYGENLGIGIGDPYPGDIEFDKLIEENGIGGASIYVKRNTSEEKRLMWRAMNGTLFASLPFVSTLFGIQKNKNGGTIKLQKSWTKIPKVLRKAIKGFGKTIDKTTTIPAQVKYYGPTMGKTTSIRTNPSLVDFDAIMREPSKELLKKYGFDSKYQMFESGNQDAIKEYQDLLVQKMNEFKFNPNNSGKTLIVSQSPVVNPEDTGFQFDNEPSIPSKDVFVSRNVGRGGTTFDSEDWWTNLIQKNPNLKIDNRFVSDIEGSKELIHVPKIVIPDIRTYHLVDSSMPSSRPISLAERLGIPKNERPMYDPEVFQKAKLFAEEYGYPEPKTPTEIKDMYRRHNTFFRTVGDLDRVYFPKNYESLPDEFKSLSLPEQRKFLASRGYPSYFRGYFNNIEGPFSDEFVFVSPSLEENADYFINNALDNTVKLQRPFSLRDPKKWHIEADWRIHPANSWKERWWPKGRIEIGNASPSREFKVSTKHLIPVDIAKQDDLGTLLPQYFRKRINDVISKDWWERPKWLQEDYNGNYEIDYLGILPEKFNYKQGGILKAKNGDLIGPPVPKNIKYTIKAGDSLGKIAKENGLSLDQLLQSNPQYKANPNKISIGDTVQIPFKRKPPTIFSIPESEDYTIKKGDTLSKIANENGVSLSEVLKLNPKYKNNPNLIVVGQKIKLPKSQKYEPTWQNIEDVRLKESEFNKNNLSAIQSVQHTGNYVVVDKKNHKVTVYDKFNQPLYASNKLSTGASGDDYNTITYVDKSGNIKSGVGNMSTPAGITTISGISDYHGFPAFQRTRVGTNDEVASSFHLGNVCTKSNGCVRMDGKTLSDLDKYIKKGTPVYTLPEQEGSRFVVRDGKLSFVADNTYGVDFGPRLYKAKDRSQYKTNEDYLKALEKERVSRENFAERVKTNKNFAQLINGRSFDEVLNSDDYKKRFWDDYNVYIDKTYNPLSIELKDNNKSKRWKFHAKTFADQITSSKSKIMSDFGLDSDTYNTLAQLAVGIAEQETKFGTSKKKLLKDVVGDKTISFVKHLGDTYNYLSKEKLFTERSSFVPSIAGTFIPSIAKAFNETKNVPHHNSKGYTQIKLTGDNKEMQKIYKKYNITPENIDKNPNLSAVATMLRLAHMYNSEIKGRKFTDANGNTINPMDALLYKWMGRNKELVNLTATPDKNKYIKNVHNYSTNFDYYTLK